MAFQMILREAELVGAIGAVVAFTAIVLGVTLVHGDERAAAVNAPMVTVIQQNREFHPDTLAIMRGTAVHILNDDQFTHHVYVKSPTTNFDSGEDPVGTVVKIEFDHPGTFQVPCGIHPTMRLWVTVK